MVNQCYVYDFTTFNIIPHGELKKKLQLKCKKWCFQLERAPTTGREHYQGRFSLKEKLRINRLQAHLELEGAHFSVTSNHNKGNDFYVTKEDTRVAGPWADTDPFIPRELNHVQQLYPWQQAVVDSASVYDERHINIIIDKTGNIGKTILIKYMVAHKHGEDVPMVPNAVELMQIVYGMETQKCYLFDMPRAQPKGGFREMFMAIETIKNGQAYDKRYSFKRKRFDNPVIWVFSNTRPKASYLSADRWILWQVNNDAELVPYQVGKDFWAALRACNTSKSPM